MAWVVQEGETVHLPFIEVTKQAGEKISQKEMKDANQTDDDIKSLIAGGAIKEEGK